MSSSGNKPHTTGSEPSGIGLKRETKKQSVYKMLSNALRPSTQDMQNSLVQKNSSLRRLGRSTESLATITDKSKSKARDLLSTVSSSTGAGSLLLNDRSCPGSALADAFKNLTTASGQTSIPCKDKFISGSDENNNSQLSRNDLPMGLIPPPMKDCHLNNVLRSARRSLEALREVRESLSNLVAEDEHLSRGMKKVNPGPELIQLSKVAETITILSREAFVPAHRLNQTAIALYNAEDFLRYPTDIRTFDISGNSRIKLPEPHFNLSTIEKLRNVVDKSTASYNGFEGKGSMSQDLHDMHFTLMRAFQDFYTCTLGCQEVFKVLLYTSQKEKQHLQQFLLSLPSMERSDMLTEVQDLRRLIDELVIFLEKLSWGSFVVYRLASGKSPEDALLGTPKFDALHTSPVQSIFKPKSKSKDLEKKKSNKSDKKPADDESTEYKSAKIKVKDASESSVTPKKMKLKKPKSKVNKAKKDKESLGKAADMSPLELPSLDYII